jgi:VanZ family protein
MSDRSRIKRLLRAIWFLAVFIVIVASLLPNWSYPMRALNRLHISDKLEHALAYLVLGLLPSMHEHRRFAISANLGAICLGIFLEFAQGFLGWRDFEIGDMVADSVGVLSGALLALLLRTAPAIRRLRTADERAIYQ